MNGSPLRPEWLDPVEMDAWLSFLITSRLLLVELDRQLQRDAGIPHAWYAMLAVLSEQPSRTCRQSDLATVADFSLSRLSYAVSRLTDRGWVRREVHPSDRRAANVVLTDTGAAALAAAAPGHAAAVRHLFLDPLTAEQVRNLRDACRAILPGLTTNPTLQPLP